MGVEIDPDIPSDEYIFNRRFKCLINELENTSIEYLKLFGHITTGDRNIDKELANQWITTYKTIAEMATLFGQGITVKVPSMKDVEVIYRYVEHHLARWANVARVSLNRGDMPVEDLLLLDKFATALYPYAREMTSNIADNPFERFINNEFINIDNVLGKKQPKPISQEDQENNTQIEQRESFANAFMDKTRWR